VAKKTTSAGTRALVALTGAGVPHTVHTHPHNTGTGTGTGTGVGYGMEAAVALGLPPEQVFKTLMAEVDGALTVDVVYVSGGRRAMDIGIAPADLIALTGAIVADVARG
jgi:Cys-tRNA(Pro)/Cys-tRNA(Cys) deacylase